MSSGEKSLTYILYEPIVIDNWKGGIADSAYKGIRGSHYEMVGLDINKETGVIQIAQKMTASASTIKGLIRNFVSSTSTECYAIGGTTDSPQLYKSTDSGVTWTQKYPTNEFSPGMGQGSIIWRGYIFIAGNSKLDLYNGATDSDTIGWKTIDTDNDYHPMWMGERDGALYIGCKNYVALLTEVTNKTFNPNDSTTYTWNSQALDIPSDFRIRSMEEIGNYLMLGCWKVVKDSVGNVYHTPTAIIYPWNYVLRPSSHEGPISMRRFKGVTAQLNINNTLYAWVGPRGEIFYYNGTRLIKLKQVPKYTTAVVEPGAVVSNFNDIPYFGLEHQSTDPYPGGIYSFGAKNEKYPLALSLEFPLSPGQDLNYRIGAIHVSGTTDNILLAGWKKDGENYGIDYLDTAAKLATGAYFTTLLRRVATAKDKAIIDGFQIFLDDNLDTGQIINIKWRRDTGDSWTTAKSVAVKGNTYTMAYSEGARNRETYVPYKINDVVNLQIKVEFTTTGNTTPKLREVRIR